MLWLVLLVCGHAGSAGQPYLRRALRRLLLEVLQLADHVRGISFGQVLRQGEHRVPAPRVHGYTVRARLCALRPGELGLSGLLTACLVAVQRFVFLLFDA